ncbi:MAG: hypothetical protein JSS24_04765 [Proteobacteria bacterium]|nr:hypothetical protein [Pseudomonadota bacterium]
MAAPRVTEWLKIMLEEIERKRLESQQAQEEERLRQEQHASARRAADISPRPGR